MTGQGCHVTRWRQDGTHGDVGDDDGSGQRPRWSTAWDPGSVLEDIPELGVGGDATSSARKRHRHAVCDKGKKAGLGVPNNESKGQTRDVPL